MYSFSDKNPPAVLTIAGSDSGGGAGIQIDQATLTVPGANFQKADLKTFTALVCYGASVVTAVTAQNTKGVQDVHAVPSEFVERQVRLVRF